MEIDKEYVVNKYVDKNVNQIINKIKYAYEDYRYECKFSNTEVDFLKGNVHMNLPLKNNTIKLREERDSFICSLYVVSISVLIIFSIIKLLTL